MTDINEIKAMALAYGACDKASGITSIKEAIELLMTPQGREFAVKSGFPTLDVWRKVLKANPEEFMRYNNLIIDNNDNALPYRGTNLDTIAVGTTQVTCYFDQPDKLYHVIAMHGAKVTINASNYAVVTVSSYDAEVTVETDGTALVFVEEAKRKGGKQ